MAQKCRPNELSEATEGKRERMKREADNKCFTVSRALPKLSKLLLFIKRNVHNEWYGACIKCLLPTLNRISRVDDTIELKVSNRFNLIQKFFFVVM